MDDDVSDLASNGAEAIISEFNTCVTRARGGYRVMQRTERVRAFPTGKACVWISHCSNCIQSTTQLRTSAFDLHLRLRIPSDQEDRPGRCVHLDAFRVAS